MPNERSDQTTKPLREWLPKMLLTFLVLLVLVFVVYRAMISTSENDIGTRSMWALIVAMVLLVLLPVVDRIQTISVSPSGFEATLSEVQAQALEEVSARVEDPNAVKKARASILQAKQPAQVQEAVKEAVKLNVIQTVELLEEAIEGNHKCYVRYRPDPTKPVQTYHVAPQEIKPGKTQATRDNDYLWAYSYEHESLVSLRLDRVVRVETSEETFDPADLVVKRKKKPGQSLRE